MTPRRPTVREDAAVAEESSARRGVQAASAVGVVVGAVAVAFVVRTLLRDREEIRAALDGAEPGWLVLALLLAAAGMTAIALPWRRALRLVGGDLPTGHVVARYYLGEIGKYVPGGVWPVLGRAELARRHGLPRTVAYSSVALSLATLYLCALFVVLLGLPALLAGDDGSGPVALVLLLPLGLVLLHPAVLRRGLSLAERATHRSIDVVIPSWRDIVTLVARYLPAWLAIGTATWSVARALDPHADLANVGAAAVLSWVVGFVLVPVPGGVGVREAAFIAAAGSLDPGIAAATAVLARAVFVTVDVVGALLGAAALRAARRRTTVT